MKYPRLTLGMAITAGCMIVAVLVPSVRGSMMDASEAVALEIRKWQASREWESRMESAYGGDVEAMYDVGMMMLAGGPFLLRDEADESYADKGAFLVSRAAERGHPAARFMHWRWYDGSIEGLREVLPRDLDSTDVRILGDMPTNRYLVAIDFCAEDLVAEYRTLWGRIRDRSIGRSPDREDAIRAGWTKWEATFDSLYAVGCGK